MILYEVEGKHFAIIEGELWQRILPVAARIANPSPTIGTKPSQASKSSISAPVVSKAKGKRVDPAIKQEILVKYQGGQAVAELAKEYKQYLSYASVYLICKNNATGRKTGNSGDPLKLFTSPRNYVCDEDHHFASKFPLSHARCPRCKQLAVEIDEGSITEVLTN